MKPCISYNFSWALHTSGVFRKKYARATKIFQLITNHDEVLPAWLLSHDQEKWNRYKKIIKFVEKTDLESQPCVIDKHLCSYIADELSECGLYPNLTLD